MKVFMKKSLAFLILFCLALCMIFTACARIPAQNTAGAGSTFGQTVGETTESTTESTTEGNVNQKPYEVVYTRVRETKALATEIPALQEKIDRNYEMTYNPKVQQKVIVQFGNKCDVPYLFRNGYRYYVKEDYIMIEDPDLSIPSFSDLKGKEEYLPQYTYTGTEPFVIELNDEIHYVKYGEWHFYVYAYDGSATSQQTYQSFKEMYANLPKGKYFVYFHLSIEGNDIVKENGELSGREYKMVTPSFILELQ